MPVVSLEVNPLSVRLPGLVLDWGSGPRHLHPAVVDTGSNIPLLVPVAALAGQAPVTAWERARVRGLGGGETTCRVFDATVVVGHPAWVTRISVYVAPRGWEDQILVGLPLLRQFDILLREGLVDGSYRTPGLHGPPALT